MSCIRDYIDQFRIIDAHEHLATPQIRKDEKHDFFWLLHYLDSDLVAAGMQRGILGRDSKLSEREKFKIFLEYWEKTKNTTYAWILKVALKDLYDFQDWTIESLMELNSKIKENSQKETWYDEVLVKKCKIDLVFDLIFTTNLNYDLYRPVMFIDFLYRIHEKDDIAWASRNSVEPVQSLEGYLQELNNLLDRYHSEGMVGLKFGHAYWRSLEISYPSFDEVSETFCRLLNSGETKCTTTEVQQLQDFIIHHIVKYSIAKKLPIQIHTGHLEPSVSGDGNIITNSNVTSLIPLFLKYPDAKFVLLHCGYPYHEQYLSIVKNHPNTYADLSWVYAMSPTAAKQILHQMIEMVPMVKIQGFGGDYSHIEGTYGHLKLAKKIVSEVLQEKVDNNDLDEVDAIDFANNIFRNNLIDLYNLDLKKSRVMWGEYDFGSFK